MSTIPLKRQRPTRVGPARAVLVALVVPVLSLALVVPPAPPASAATATAMVDLGTAASYAVLSGASVGNTVNAPTAPHTTLRGDLGVSSGTAPTGFPPGVVLGTTRVGAGAVPAYNDLVKAYDEVAARTGGEPLSGDLAGKTLTPGLHANVGAVANTGTVILDGQGDPASIFVLKVNGALAAAASSHVTLVNGAQASRVFWQVNGAASIGATSTFAGTIMASAAIAIGAGTVVNGRALARTGAISLDSNEFYTTPPLVSITGGAATTTTDTTPAISGTTNIVAPALVTVTVNGQTLTTAPGADGSWSVTSGLLVNATYPVAASVSDPAGNVGSATQELTVDTVLPIVTINGGGAVITNDTTPTISGTTDVAVGQIVSVVVAAQALSALVQADGTWNVTPNPALSDGTRTVTATVRDPAGNVGSASQTLTIDTTGATVTITGGASALTNDPTPTITGTADVPAGTTVAVTFVDQTLTGLVQADQSWSVTSVTVVSDGPHLVTMSVSDVAGNPSSTTQSLTVDTAPPAITITGGAAATTNDLTPTISGTTAASAGSTVTVTIAGQTMTTLVQGNGTWNTTPSPVSEGTLTVVATVPDPAGNIGRATQVLTVDTAGPVVTINGGASATTADATPTVTGASADVAIGSTVTVTVAGQTLTTTIQAGGTWTVTAAVISNGTHFVFVTVTDPAGNPGSATQSLTVNAVLPVVAIDGGASAATNDTTPTITGTTDAATGSAVSVTVSGQSLTATVQPGGSWSVTAAELARGTTTVAVAVTDPSGNVGNATQTLTVSPPTAFDGGPTLATNDTTPTISGTTDAPDGEVATVTVGGQTLTSPVTDGTWTVTPAPLADGSYDVVVSISNADGAPQVATQVLTIDTVAPVVEPTGGPAVQTDDPTPPITGSGATPGSTVVVTVDGQTLTTVVGADGTWSVTPATLPNGSHDVVVTITDPAGNEGTGQQTITVVAPAVADPLAPVSVTSTATGAGGAVVTWGAPASGAAPSSFTVTPSAGSGATAMTVGPTTRTASFTGLTGATVTFAVTATRATGTSGPATSNAVDAAAATPVRDLVSDRQYQLSGSNGVTWVDIDPVNLAAVYRAPAAGQLALDANIDLWTAAAGVNQDVAVVVSGGAYGTGTVVAWKESGGFAGTFSPNAAAVNTAVVVEGGIDYTVKLAWKANIAAPGKTIYAGAGPIGGGFSPTRLTARFTPATNPVALTKRTDQFVLTGSDGTTWRSMTSTTAGATVAPVTRTFTATATGIAAITGNADLWTWNAQYNQDLGLKVSGGAYGTGQIVAWKESGGFAGTFSPNAALVEARIDVADGIAYTVELVWKANKPMPAGVRISAAAGSPGAFSPTSLTVAQHPAATTASRASAAQYRLDGSNGTTWRNLTTPTGGASQQPFSVSYTAPTDGYVHLIGNTDLWTYAAGYNQDIGIAVTASNGEAGTAPGGIVAWKESGGFAGTFSPNAAAVEGYHPVKAGTTYTFTLVWKMNKPAGATVSISAGAGNPGNHSPTRLDLTFQPS